MELDKTTNLDFLYPTKNDPDFAKNIANRREFSENKQTVIIPTSERQIEAEAITLCAARWEKLAPHQLFVRNFLSVMTPYNSLLLYHGLGTGKTCSAIGVAEEMRDYFSQIGISKKIIVVASVNVQDNFRKQLFDISQLKFDRTAKEFTIKGCTGTKFLKEIGNIEVPDYTEKTIEELRTNIAQRIIRLINASYEFIGYIELANMIKRITNVTKKEDGIQGIKNIFNDRLLIIDEIHNVRNMEESNPNPEKKVSSGKNVAKELYKLVKHADHLRLLLLSGTPMYNDPQEIVWLLNLMNVNDGRDPISVSDVFDRNGNLLKNGADLIRMKSNGYVSVVKGENPYAFPFRMYPEEFSKETSFLLNREIRPVFQLNNTPIVTPMQHLDLCMIPVGSYQELVYNYVVDQKRSEIAKDATSFGSFFLKQLIEALNIVYPSMEFDKVLDKSGKKQTDLNGLLGDGGLKRIMKHETSETGMVSNFEYKTTCLTKYGRIFSKNEISKYSCKISNICKKIEESTGIVLIYSEYISGGALPLAFALEELGYTRYDTKVGSLFKTPPVSQKNQQINGKRCACKYAMFTGDKQFSPDNRAELEALTTNNEYGQRIKVVIISKAGSEGIDFKNVRQVHVMEPWYNMSRIEQIIGRAVRNCSHFELPFVERNVQIFLYGTLLTQSPTIEAADMYVYRLAEMKAIQIGKVARIIKQNAVDCLLNIEQVNLSQAVIYNHNKQNVTVKQVLSDGTKLSNYVIGDRPFSFICDYDAVCEYECNAKSDDDVNSNTYSKGFIEMNVEKIIRNIRDLFRDQHFYSKEMIEKRLMYPKDQINYGLTQMIQNKEVLVDKYDRKGALINIGKYYLFQPIELKNYQISTHDRMVPLQFKHEHIAFPLKDEVLKGLAQKHSLNVKPLDSTQELPSELVDAMSLYETIVKMEKIPVDKNSKTWKDLGSDLLNELHETFKISMNTLKRCLLHHFLEDIFITISLKSRLKYLNLLYTRELSEEFHKFAKDYFDEYILDDPGHNEEGLLFLNSSSKTGLQLVIRSKKELEPWHFAESNEDWMPYMKQIVQILPSESELSHIFGFVVDFKEKSGGNHAVFKIKYTGEKGTGARVDQISSKQRRLTILNQIIDGIDSNPSPIYTMENTKNKNTVRYCYLIELLLRSYAYDKKNKKNWFLTPIQAVRLLK